MSGANGVLPTIPFFTNSAPSLTDLSNLSYAVSFVADCDTRPTWKFYLNANQSITANTWHPMNLPKVAFDSDGTYDSTGATVVTQGWYTLKGSAQFQQQATKYEAGLSFLVTGGSNNPHLASGSTKRFGFRADEIPEQPGSNADSALCTSCRTPICMYPGDKLRFHVYATAAAVVSHNSANNYQQGRFVPYFSGYFERTGT